MKSRRRPAQRATKKARSQPFSVVDTEAYRRVLDALALKRRNPQLSMTAAAKLSGTTVPTICRHAAQVLLYSGRRIDVKKTDRLLRAMRMLTPRGEVVVYTRDFYAASRMGSYNNALRLYVRAGDATALGAFAGKSVKDIDGKTYEFVTDTSTLNRLARAGVVRVAEIYATDGPP